LQKSRTGWRIFKGQAQDLNELGGRRRPLIEELRVRSATNADVSPVSSIVAGASGADASAGRGAACMARVLLPSVLRLPSASILGTLVR